MAEAVTLYDAFEDAEADFACEAFPRAHGYGKGMEVGCASAGVRSITAMDGHGRNTMADNRPNQDNQGQERNPNNPSTQQNPSSQGERSGQGGQADAGRNREDRDNQQGGGQQPNQGQRQSQKP